MKRLLPLLLILTGLFITSCKSKDVPKQDPYEKIDKAYDEHMDKNKEQYDKDPD
jgi:hypothetical protein